MQALKVQVNQQIEKMRKEFISDNMGFRTLQKEGQDAGGETKNVSMNLKDKVKPTYGVEVKNGDDVQVGPEYQSKKADGRLTRKQYKEQYEQMQQRGVQKPQKQNFMNLFNASAKDDDMPTAQRGGRLQSDYADNSLNDI